MTNPNALRFSAVLLITAALAPSNVTAQGWSHREPVHEPILIPSYIGAPNSRTASGGPLFVRTVATFEKENGDPWWSWVAAGAVTVLGGTVVGYSFGFVGGQLFDTPCFDAASRIADAGAAGGAVVTISLITVAVPIAIGRRGRNKVAERDPAATSDKTDNRLGAREWALTSLAAGGIGATFGAVGGALKGGSSDACGGRWHATRDAALHLAAGGLFSIAALALQPLH
jgi:hypothetical protein